MKKRNMIRLCKNIIKIKQAMIDKYSIVDDEYILRDLIENKTDIPAKDVDKVDKMVDTVLYLIENEECFVKEIENEIVKRVGETFKPIANKDSVKYYQILNILESHDIIESKIAYYPDLEKNLSTEDGKMESYLVIPITSNLQKHLFIEFDVIERKIQTLNSEIEVKNIYID